MTVPDDIDRSGFTGEDFQMEISKGRTFSRGALEIIKCSRKIKEVNTHLVPINIEDTF